MIHANTPAPSSRGRHQHLAPKRLALAALAAILLFTGALNVRSAIGNRDDAAWEADPASRSAADRLVDAPARLPTPLDGQILSLQDTLRANPDNGRAATLLGDAYLQKARETGDPSYYPKAEALYSIALEADERDFAAMTGLGTLALARHHFAEALAWGERAREINPHYPAAYGVIGDAQIELGRYEEAVVTIQRMVDLRPDLPSFARVSYARELMGDLDGAIAAMERAALAGAGRGESVAWAQVQIGNLLFAKGDLDGAQRRYEQSLVSLPAYVHGQAGLARIAAARGDYVTSIRRYEEAIRTMPLPELVIALGDVYLSAGRPEEAEQQYALVDAMQRLYREHGVDTDVEMALFDADHNRNLDAAVARAKEANTARPSIKTADVLAWTLYKAGDLQGARAASQDALRLGTQDALMFFHAGTIDAALGNREAALGHLGAALALNPHFSVLYAGEARATVEQLNTNG